MNRKLVRYLDEIVKTEGKIAELQEYLKSVRQAQKQEEDLEIVRSIRSMKLSGHDLMELLNGLQDGTLTIKTDEPEKEQKNKSQMPELASESEDLEDEEMEEIH
ncbi:MAG: DUF4315 family protein [Clostridia bacterium]|nr:DUF4315 family protein [Clostridia bacterium]